MNRASLLLGLLVAVPAAADLENVREASNRRNRAAADVARIEAEAERVHEDRQSLLRELEASRARAAAARERLDRMDDLSERITDLGRQIAASHRDYAGNPRDESLYDRLQSLRHALEDTRREREAIGQERGSLEAAIEEARRAIEESEPALRAFDRRLEEIESRAARRRADRARAQRDFEAAIEADPEAREVYDSIRRSDGVVDDFLEAVFAQADAVAGERAPGDDRTLIFAIEGELKMPVAELKIKGQGKHRVAVTQKADGTYRVTVLTEAGAGLQGKWLGVSGTDSAVGQARLVYEFDPALSGDMVHLAGLLAVGQVIDKNPSLDLVVGAAEQALDLLPDDLVRGSVRGLARGLAEASKLLGTAADAAAVLDPAPLTGIVREKVSSGSKAVERLAGDERIRQMAEDMLIAYKHLGRDAGERLTVVKYTAGPEADIESGFDFAKIKGTGQSVVGLEWRYEIDDSGRRKLAARATTFESTLKGDGRISGLVGGDAAISGRFEVKHVVPVDPREAASLEAYVKENVEVSAGTGPEVMLRAGVGKRSMKKFVLEGIDREISIEEALGAPGAILGRSIAAGNAPVATEETSPYRHLKLDLDLDVFKLKGKALVMDSTFDHEAIHDED